MIHMSRIGALMAVAVALFIAGCGGPGADQQKQAQMLSQLKIDLEATKKQLAKADEERQKALDQLAAQERKLKQAGAEKEAMNSANGEQERLVQELETRDALITKLQAQLKETEEEAARLRSNTPGSADPAKIRLMGAKALAEYKAQQLEARVAQLEKDMDGKQEALDRITAQAQSKETEVQSLKQTIETLQSGEQKRSQELEARLANLSEELNQRTTQLERLKKELTGELEARTNEVVSLKKEQIDRAGQIEALKNALALLAKEKATTEAKLIRLQEESAGGQQKFAEITKTLEEANGKISGLQTLVDQSRKEHDRCLVEAEELRMRMEEQASEAEGLRDQLARLNLKMEENKPAEAQPSQETADQQPPPTQPDTAQDRIADERPEVKKPKEPDAPIMSLDSLLQGIPSRGQGQ